MQNLGQILFSEDVFGFCLLFRCSSVITISLRATILDITHQSNPNWQVDTRSQKKLRHPLSPPVHCCKPWRNNFWYFAMIQSRSTLSGGLRSAILSYKESITRDEGYPNLLYRERYCVKDSTSCVQDCSYILELLERIRHNSINIQITNIRNFSSANFRKIQFKTPGALVF